MRFLQGALIFAIAASAGSCMKWDYGDLEEEFSVSGEGLFILCEGNFQYSNATLSFYEPATGEVINEAFLKSNGMKLGDVAQSMTMYDDKAWIVVNNSHVVFAVNPDTFREIGRIENLTSPRYIHFVSDEKAYVTQLWDNRIFIVDPRRYMVMGYIEVPGMAQESGSTEQMVQIGDYVYCTCWSYQNSLIKIDTRSDKVTARLELGIQPRYLAKDGAGKIWVLTDGGFDGSPYGLEAPVLYRIDPISLSVEKSFTFPMDATPRDLKVDKEGATLYWVNEDVWRMSINSERLPVSPFIVGTDKRFYAITLSPYNGDIYLADAIDYQQKGLIYRFSESGQYISEFYVGITPGAFCWK